jgi:hypothetical protein
MSEPYAGKDVLLERIRKYWENNPVTWNESCRLIAEQIFNEGLLNSAKEARANACEMTGNQTYEDLKAQVEQSNKELTNG